MLNRYVVGAYGQCSETRDMPFRISFGDPKEVPKAITLSSFTYQQSLIVRPQSRLSDTNVSCGW